MITHLYIKTNLDKSVGTGNKIGNKPPTSSDITILSWNILDTVKRTQKFFLALMLSKDPSHIEQKNPILSIFTLFYPSPERLKQSLFSLDVSCGWLDGTFSWRHLHNNRDNFDYLMISVSANDYLNNITLLNYSSFSIKHQWLITGDICLQVHYKKTKKKDNFLCWNRYKKDK